MKRDIYIACCLLFIAPTIAVMGQTHEQQVSNLVLFVLDGCRADYLDLAPMPNLQELKKNGMTYTNAWVGLMISNTPPSHAALQTGLYPKNNGIIGFYWKLAGKKIWVKPSKWDSVLRGEQERILLENNAIGFIGKLKEKGEFLAASISGHKFYAAEAMGGPLCDIVTFPSWGIENRLSEEQKQYGDWQSIFTDKKSKTAKLAFVRGKSPSQEVIKEIEGKNISREFGDDESSIEIAMSIIKHQRPEVLLVNLPHLDHLGHKAAGGYGKWRSVMGNHMTRIDELIGKVLNEYKKNGVYDKTLFIVLSDHGMVTNGKTVLAQNIIKKLGKKVLSFQKGTVSSLPWFWNMRLTKEEMLSKCDNLANSKLPYLRAIYYKDYENGNYHYKLIHAYEAAIEKDLDEAYRYLLDTQANDNSPDLFLIPFEHTLIIGDIPADSHGDHNSPTWRVQHIPMIISGPGIKKDELSDYPARLVDIAPTILKLFNFEPDKMDGIVLSDALINPDENEQIKQEFMKKYLEPLIKALKRVSDEDLKIIYPALSDPTRIP
jgi:arylsulfatase A-like enzyme